MKERILQFIDYLDISTAAFEKKVKLSNGFVNNIGASVREKTIAKISFIFPELNINWWKTGEGNMLNNDSINYKKKQDNSLVISYNDFNKIIQIQQDSNFLQKELNEHLKIAQEQLTESQKQITSLLEILKSK